VVDAITGIANSRGVFPREYMADTTQIMDCPDECRAMVEKADPVVSSWLCSVNAPLFNNLRKENGLRWVKITYFRNLDLLHTPQARFPVELVGESFRLAASKKAQRRQSNAPQNNAPNAPTTTIIQGDAEP
jgi:hypothetical protein